MEKVNHPPNVATVVLCQPLYLLQYIIWDRTFKVIGILGQNCMDLQSNTEREERRERERRGGEGKGRGKGERGRGEERGRGKGREGEGVM